jgi:signal peptidase I
MENTLLVGDHLLVDKLLYSPTDGATHSLLPYRDVRRGDIIVFRYPLDLDKNLVKRAIGVPGDHIRLENKQLIRNGQRVTEPYAIHIDQNFEPYRDNFPSGTPVPFGAVRAGAVDMLEHDVVNGELVVPPGYVFAMGDNRENSDDSRYWGLVPRENIVGTPVIIYWSYDASTEELSDPNIGIGHMVDVVTHFFTKTRWGRTFKLIRGAQAVAP